MEHGTTPEITAAVASFVFDRLSAAGFEVITDKDEFDRILAEENIVQKMSDTSKEETNPLFLADENELKAFAQKVDDWKAGTLSSNEIITEFLADPVMVFNSATRSDSFTVMTEAMDKNNETVLVALQISKKQGNIVVNEITSAYGKDANEWFIEQIKLGNLMHENKQKSLEWSHRRGLSLPTRMTTQGSLT